MTISDIMRKYTTGELSLEKTNEALEDAGATFHVDLERNVLTEAEIEETLVGKYPHQARGWGLLDTGTGSLDKVEIVKGILPDVDCGEMYALCFVAGRMYHVKGSRLVE